MPIGKKQINGQPGAYLQPPRYGRSESGRYTIYTWEGSRDQVLAQVPAIEQFGGTWDLTESYTKARLEARFPRDFIIGQNDFIDTWELFATEAEKDLLEWDNAAVNSLSMKDKEIIRQFIQNPDEVNYPAVPQDFDSGATGFTIFQLMQKGVKTVRVFVPTLRHTYTVANTYNIVPSQRNVGSIISTLSLPADSGFPAQSIIFLPNGSSNDPNLAYGWYKKYPQIVSAARQKVQIVQEWEFGLWPTIIYGNPL